MSQSVNWTWTVSINPEQDAVHELTPSDGWNVLHAWMNRMKSTINLHSHRIPNATRGMLEGKIELCNLSCPSISFAFDTKFFAQFERASSFVRHFRFEG